MTGRKGLTWVTALTVASLLLGGGALNALAEEHGGGNRGRSGQAHAEHQQQKPAVANQTNESGESEDVKQASPASATATAHESDDDKNQNDNGQVQRKHEDDTEDLVTPPARVTEESRPGLGCGDDNHTHTGAPGNAEMACKHDDGDNKDGNMTTDDDADVAVTVAGAEDRASAVADNRDAD